MAVTTLNLGQVSAIKQSAVAPSNTKLLWYDTSITVGSPWKYYNLTTGQWELLTTVEPGPDPGPTPEPGDGSARTSFVFLRTNAVPPTPTGGSYTHPVPAGWNDGLPPGEQMLWMSLRVFTIDGLPPQQPVWSTPTMMTDTATLDVEYSSVPTNPGTPSTHQANWHDASEATPDDIWMAMRVKKNGVWGEWAVFKVKGEMGDSGPDGASPEFRYAQNGSFTAPPSLNASARTPAGWSLTSPPETVGNYVWETIALVNPDNTLKQNWSTPHRVSGIPGPAGPNGVDGTGFVLKGEVPNYQSLPTSGMILGDAYLVASTGKLYVFNGTSFPAESQGIQFVGPPGTSLYTWIKYADTPTSGMSDSSVGKDYIGLAYNKTTSVESTNYSDYSWSTVGGEGTPGPPGADGVSLYTWIKYADTPTSGMADFPDGKAYLGLAYNKTTSVESTNYNDYSWSKIEGPEGVPGPPGDPGVPGIPGDGYEFKYAAVERGNNPPSINTEVGWVTGIPTLTNTQTLWMKVRIHYGDHSFGEFGPWEGPIKMTGDDGETIQGPSMAYRGDWSALKQYRGNEYVVDVVKYVVNGKGYIARTDVDDIPIGTLPTNTDYWNEFTTDVDALFTDFLFAYSGYIQNLTVGQFQTATEGERYTIGFEPTVVTDPTSNMNIFTKHAARSYYESNRILMYDGIVNNFVYNDGTNDITVTGQARIIFKDEAGSPVHYVLDSTSSTGITYITTPVSSPQWFPAHMLRLPTAFQSINKSTSSVSDFHSQLPTTGSSSALNQIVFGLISYAFAGSGNLFINYNHSYQERMPGSAEPVQDSRFVTFQNNNDPIPDGWYFLTFSPTNGVFAGNLVSLDPNTGTNTWPAYANISLTIEFHYIENGYVINSVTTEQTYKIATDSPAPAFDGIILTNTSMHYSRNVGIDG